MLADLLSPNDVVTELVDRAAYRGEAKGTTTPQPGWVQAAIVLASVGQWNRFLLLFRLLRLDYRGVLVAGGLADADWPSQLEAELPGPRPDG